MALKERYVDALCCEIERRKHYISSPLKTIYLGGGTPSTLTASQLSKLFDTIKTHFCINQVAEVTIECNPDDITPDFLNSLAILPISRISMGIQSFVPEELLWLNRRHTAQQAISAIHLCRQYGYDNISVDLMFALPVQTLQSWQYTLDTAFLLDVEHISAYSLMYEESSALTKLYNAGKIDPVSDEDSQQMFNMLCSQMHEHGFVQYEISNFAKPNKHSQHNSSYWSHIPYLGIGAAAHSFNGTSRQANIADTRAYVIAIEQYQSYFSEEQIDDVTFFNEHIFTALRTKEGVSLSYIQQCFGKDRVEYILQIAEQFIKSQHLKLIENHLSLTQKGLYVSDMIMSEFMIVN